MVQQCGAKCRVGPKQIAKAAAKGPEALSKLLRRDTCKQPVVPGRSRCYLHGGLSTGPRSDEAKQQMSIRTAAARAGKPRNPRQPNGRYTLHAKLIRRAVTQCVIATVDRRHARRGLNSTAD
jgi:hypothetical protein